MTRRGEDPAESVDLLSVVIRWAVGLPLDGMSRTNAGWVRPGEEIVWWPDGRLPRRADWWPRLVRAAVRWLVSAWLVAVWAAWRTWPDVTPRVLLTGAVLAGMWGCYRAGWQAADGLLLYRHKRDWVRPTHAAIRALTGWPATVQPEHYLDIPVNFADPGSRPIRVYVPAEVPFEDERTKNLVAGVRRKLARPEQRAVWHLTGREHYVELLPAKLPPPATLDLRDPVVRYKLERLSEPEVLIGVTHDGELVVLNLDTDAPHMLINGSSGAGKSVLVASILAQILHRGGAALVLDYKWFSHKWAQKLPNVHYACRIEAIHDALVWAAAEVNRRVQVVAQHDDDAPEGPDVGPRIPVVVEEGNSTQIALKRYWSEIRTKDDPKESPALDALRHVSNMGRAVHMHLFYMTQSGSAEATGGRDVRENYYFRAIKRATTQTWRFLAPGVWPMPKTSNHPGRWQIVIGDEAKETQVLWVDEPSHRKRRNLLRQYSVAGVLTPIEELMAGTPDVAESQGHSTPGSQGREAVTVTGRRLRALPTPTDDEIPSGMDEPEKTLVTLREAVEIGVVTDHSYDSLRQARYRDVTFPEPVGKDGTALIFKADDFREWEEAKRRESGKEGETA